MAKYLLLLILSGALTLFIFRYVGNNEVKHEVIHKTDINKICLEEILLQLGSDRMIHSMDAFDSTKAAIGKDLITLGHAKVNGVWSDRISKYFVCTDCHNLEREFEDLASQSPEDRLKYAKEHDMPFLPGSTFYGIYNRTGFFNGDYLKKYGDMVKDVNDTLRNAIQLCSKYCSAGRHLENWELEALMHYFKSRELMLSDLSLTEKEQEMLLASKEMSKRESRQLRQVLQSRYVQKYDATFLPSMPKEYRKYGMGGDAENGKILFEHSCMHCHGNKRVAHPAMEHNKGTAMMFIKNLKKDNYMTLYWIIRNGTESSRRHPAYMPNFTREKMSDAQINDLIAYMKKLANS